MYGAWLKGKHLGDMESTEKFREHLATQNAEDKEKSEAFKEYATEKRLTDAEEKAQEAKLLKVPNPEEVQDFGKQIANLDMKPFSPFTLARYPLAREAMEEAERVAKANGREFSSGDYDALQRQKVAATSGPEGKFIRSLITIKNHMDLLEEISRKLPDPTQAPFINRILGIISEQTGGIPISDFNAAKQVVATEYIKAISGSGTAMAESDRRELDNSFSSAKGHPAFMSMMHRFRELLSGQAASVTEQYSKFKPVTEVTSLTPETLRDLFIDPTTGKIDHKLVQADENRIQQILHPGAKPAAPVARRVKAKDGTMWEISPDGTSAKPVEGP